MDDLPLPASKAIFDQQPIGGNTRMMIDEYPADFDPSKLQAKPQPLPLGKRLASKVWKVKKQALEQLLKIVSSQNHKEFCEHESMIIKSMADSNVQCQLISSRILFSFLQKEGSYDGDSKTVVKNVIEKLMTIEKEQLQNLAMDILFWLMDHSLQEMLMNQLNEYLLNKNPKIMGASMKAIQALVNSYGIKKLAGLEIFSKHLKLVSDVARPMAKPQTVELYKEVYKWMGEQVYAEFVLHAEIKEEVVKWAKTYQMQPMEIKRGLRKGQQGKKINPMEEEHENDTPVDILHHFDSRWVDFVLQIQKWQQKKQHLEQFIKKTRVGAIVPRQTSHYITLLKRLFSQNNINLLQCGFKIVKNLCKGLKKAFAISCKSFLSYVYLKLKDSKVMIVDETLATLKAMTYSITLEDMQEEIRAGLRDKSPQMRLNTLKLLKEISAKKQPKTTKILKSLLQTLIGLTNDSASDVRDIALGVLCKIKEYYGMIFFEDKLESLPAKKVNQIRSTPTIGGVEENSSKMEIQDMPMNTVRSNMSLSETSIKTGGNAQNKDNKTFLQKKKPLPAPQPYINTKNNNKIHEPTIQKKQSFTSQSMERKQQMVELPAIREQKRMLRDQRSEEQQLIALRNEEWPIIPTPAHVLRLITLFTKLGEPFTTLATPFKLKNNHFQLLENSSNIFMTSNADLLLKWMLWRVQIQNSDIVEKLMSVLIHLLFLIKSNISSEQTVLIMSILSSSLQSDFSNNDMLIIINTSAVEISQFVRQKVFHFWITTLNGSTDNSEFCQKILTLIRTTFQKLQFTCEQICSMARTEPVVKNKRFMSFLLERYSRQLLTVSGFNLEQVSKAGEQWVLKQSETEFATSMTVQQRMHYFQIFKRNSTEAMQQIKKLQQQHTGKELMSLHIKLMDTIMIPYLNHKLQSINVYNYFKLFTSRISQMCEPRANQVENVTPHLRNLMRLTMFFLIDLSESKLDNKDELTRAVNKIILVLLEKMPAEHLLEVMTLLLKYAIKNNLIKRLSQLLMKCIIKSTHSISFTQKTQKNVKLLFNFFIQLIEEDVVNDDEHIVKPVKSLFADLMANYKDLCSQIVIEKLNQFGAEGFKCKEIEGMFRNFIGFFNKNDDACIKDERMNVEIIGNDIAKIDAKIIQNCQSMSNLPQNAVTAQSNYDTLSLKPSGQLQFPNIIRQTTNIQRKTENIHNKLQPRMNSLNTIDLAASNDAGAKILQQRRRLQNYQGLYQSWEGLVKMKEEIVIPNNPQTIQQSKAPQISEQTTI